MFQILNNLPQVTKNILILNIIFFILTYLQPNLTGLLGTYYITSPLFEPFQLITHFFMHGGFFHLFLNMWLFVMLGAFLERLWGPKRFFTFYILSAVGAFLLYNTMGVYQIAEIKTQLSNIDFDILDNILTSSRGSESELINNANQYLNTVNLNYGDIDLIGKYISLVNTPLVGASGAVFGIMAAFAILFPNTEFLLYFAIPVKAKYLVGGYFLWELYQSFNGTPGDNVAHLAHVGGAVVGAVLILFWRKNDKQNFW